MDGIKQRGRIRHHTAGVTTRKADPKPSAGSGPPNTGKTYWLVRVIGKTASADIRARKLRYSAMARHFKRSKFIRIYSALVCLLFVFSTFATIIQPFIKEEPYEITPAAREVIAKPNDMLANFLTKENTKSISYNQSFAPGLSESNGSTSVSAPRIKASFETFGAEARVDDPYSETSISLKPRFGLLKGKQDSNQIMYRIKDHDGYLIYTSRITGIKEDILLNSYDKDDLELGYDLQIPSSMEARLEADGSIGIYGSSLPINGQVATGTEEDAQLLEKARQNSDKSKLLYTIPRPVAKESGKKVSDLAMRYEINGTQVYVKVNGLASASYPLSIDPSVYVETAQKLMRGNNETNTDFDVENELFQKSQTTGARIDAWQSNLNMNNGTWDHATTAAGGRIYRAGGQRGATRPSIADQQTTLQTTDSTSFTMNMPATRPAGDLYVALMCHDGTGTITPPSGGGWTEYADTREHAAYYKVGTDQGGGNEAASYTWTGGNEEWGGVIIRITGADTSSPISGTPGTGSNNGNNAVPEFPATTPNDDATLIIRAVGADADQPSDTGWLPSGHTKIASDWTDNFLGIQGPCGFVSATVDNPPSSGVSTGTVTIADASIRDSFGASSIAIKPASSSTAIEDGVYWAQFNPTNFEIESPNPGTGACAGWCTDSAYALPEARRGHQLVAYNGYLYAIGGSDGTNYESTIFIAKLGSNGEPQLWHPTDTNKNNWVYWYQSSGLNGGTARAYLGAYAYNSKMYILGGDTNTTANSGATTTVELADILPNGTLGTWSSGTALPTARYGHGVQAYNNVLYVVGGNNNGTMTNTVYYNKLNADGSMNSWVQANSFTTARGNNGGNFTTVWAGYLYLSGGCNTVNASGYCTSISTDTQIASLNADGSLSDWGSITNLQNNRTGYTFISWQNGLYRLGGCSQVNASNGACLITLADVDYGVINPAGEVSTVSISVPSGTAPCSGGTPYNCSLPPTGTGAGQGGQLLTMSTVLNGFLYVIGGCTNSGCTSTSGNVSYAAINSSGQLVAPPSCGGTSYGAWCVDSTNQVNGSSGIAAGGITVFNGRIYIVGGDSGTSISTNIYYTSVNATTGALSAWSSVDMTTVGMASDVSYTFAYARANPSSAGSVPGNLFIFGGCGQMDNGAGCTGDDYRTEVYKCNIATSGSVSSCTTTGQLQIDSNPNTGGNQGLGIHSGTVYANYIYLIGGFGPSGDADKDDVIYAKFDNNNNVVAVSGSTWTESPNKLSVGRRRGFSFGYNGHIYSIGGYDDSSEIVIPFIEWSKVNVSDGSIDPFVTSSITISQRWGLSLAVSNSFAYVIGGCSVGISPICNTMDSTVQTFQLYNNDSGTLNNFTAQSDQTFTADTDRWGASSAIYNGYLYVAGGCVSATDCTNSTNSVQYAPISANDGSIGTWAAGGNLPADRAWGSLEVAGGTLYYIGGQDDTATNEQSTVYYTTGIASGNPTWSGTAATNGLPAARTKFGATVWNNRIYVVGGLDGSAAVTNTVYVSPQLNTGGNITSAWSSSTAFNVARRSGAVTSYANNLYLFGGYDGSNYLSDSQYTQINSDGSVDSWTYTTNLPSQLSDARAVSANGYIYLVGGRSAASTCPPKTLIVPISANTTIVTGNNPTGIGEWYETNVKYTGDRYGAAVAYSNGKIYTMGGGCSSPLASNRHYYSTVKSQPQVAIYSRMIDTDTDVFPTNWLLNGVDNSIGARWNVRYRSMNDTDGVATDCGTSDMATWGQDTNFGDVTLGQIETYTPKDGSGNNINCARYYYFFISIDASKTFGYPEDVNRGPTISDITLFFTSDPSKRLRHGKTFTGGEQQPLDTPCRQSGGQANCALP